MNWIVVYIVIGLMVLYKFGEIGPNPNPLAVACFFVVMITLWPAIVVWGIVWGILKLREERNG